MQMRNIKLFPPQILTLVFFIAILSGASAQTVTRENALMDKAARFQARYERLKSEALEFAQRNNVPVRFDTYRHLYEIQYILNGIPQYYVTHNEDAAISISTDKVYSGGGAGLSLSGAGITPREWDGGGVRLSHQEYGGRVTQGDSPGSTHYHATHVAGTIMAAGVVSSAKGMAYEANLRAFDWNNDNSEMASEAAAGALMSNHSYGYVRGWANGTWYGNPSISTQEDYLFGFYDANSQAWDQIAYDAPYYLICKSAGNDRNDCGNGTYPCDGAPDGYDCIGQQGIAKNIMTVAAVEDVAGGYGGPSSVVMSSFSSWGPADDGRIKPDISANGISLYSTDDDNDTDYTTLSGTSMSSPSVTGSLALLQQHFEDQNGTGNYMKAATLKALVINTADECGAADGPDYEFGWGLMNTQSAALKITEDQSTDVISEHILNDGSTFTRDVLALGTEPLKVTIVWTDPPGTPVSPQLDPITPMLVNDLDLSIADLSTTYYPWKLDRDNPSNPATNAGENDVDNVEVIYIANPVAGNYTITVDHDGTLSGGSQAFSMILSGIDGQVPPIADFSADPTIQQIGATVEMTDMSLNNPTSWSWSFSGPGNVTYVSGTSSTSRHPEVQFDATGLYDVSLSVTNAYGNDSETKTDYINITNCTYCASAGQDASEEWISNVNLNQIDNNSGSSSGYVDYTNLSTDMAIGSTHTASVTCSSTGNWGEYIHIFIDWNQDCDFDDASETYDLGVTTGPGTLTADISVPADAIAGQTRMRVSLKYNGSPSPCETFSYGEVEDYTINVSDQSVLQTIELDTGWNIMSFYVAPPGMDMLDILQPLITSNELEKVIDEDGEFVQYVNGTGWVNNIGDMANTEGYYIKVNNATTLGTNGLEMTVPFNIPLDEGWNIMSYPFDQPQDALAAVQTLIDDDELVKVIGETGGMIVHLPEAGWINTIGDFEADEGYYIKVSPATTLILDQNTGPDDFIGKEVQENRNNRSQHFNPVWNGNPFKPMALAITEAMVDDSSLTVGDEIGVFDTNAAGDYFCVGAARISTALSDTTPLIIHASLDDPDTPTLDGFTQGNQLAYMLYDSSAQKEIQNIRMLHHVNYDSSFAMLGTALDSLWTKTLNTDLLGGAFCAGSADFYFKVDTLREIDEFQLCVEYDPAILNYWDYDHLNAQIDADDIIFKDSLDRVWINWESDLVLDLTEDTLFSLHFTSVIPDSVINDTLLWVEQHSNYYSASMQQLAVFHGGAYELSPLPLDAGPISGTDTVCQAQTGVQYVTDSIPFADDYIWEIDPANAGLLDIDEHIVYIDFGDQYAGDAVISVYGQNDCGNGSASSLDIYIKPLPGQPEQPTGPDTLMLDPPDTQYNITQVADAVDYVWMLQPDNAGELYPDETSLTVDWSNTFQGVAAISVHAVNDCGNGPVSEALEVYVGNITQIDASRNDELVIFPVPANNTITIKGKGCRHYEYARIFNTEGQLMIISKMNPDITSIDIGKLKNGVYYLQLSGEQSMIRKIIKMDAY